MTATAPTPLTANPHTPPPSAPRRRRRRRWLALGIPAGILVIVLVVGGLWWFTGFSFLRGGYGDAEGVLFDDFEGAAGAKPNPEVWSIQTGGGGWGNNELQEYTEDAVALDGAGNLVLTATVPAGGGPSTSGRITTHGNWSFTFGRLSARVKLPEGQGLLPAFWLLGDNIDRVGWPAAGEVDIIETPNTTSRSAHHIHGPNNYFENWSLNESVDLPVALADDFHVYTVEKQPGRIILAIDDQIVMDVEEWDVPVPGKWVFDDPTHALFSLAVGGNWPGDPDATTPVVNEMIIDWMLFTPADQLDDTPIGTAPGATGQQ